MGKRFLSSLGLALAIGLSGVSWAQTPGAGGAPSKPGTSSTLKAAPNRAASPSASFSIEPVPAWVQAVDVDSSAIAALPKAPVHVWLIDEQTQLGRDGQSSFHHVVKQANDSSGLESTAEFQVQFDPSYQSLVLHKLEVWRNKQRIDKLSRNAIKLLQREPQLERQILDGRLTASALLADVRVGDRVEYSYTIKGANPVFENKFVDFVFMKSSRGPAALVHYRLLAPESRNIQLRTFPDGVQTSVDVKAGVRETRLRRTHVPQFQFDPNTPEGTYLTDQVQLSEFANWNDVASWASRVFAPAFDAVTPALRSQADALKAAAGGDPVEQVRRTLDFVQTEVRYFGTENGVNSHRPAVPDLVLKQRFGDCKDKVSLLLSLLKLQGIEAAPLLVSTSLRDDTQKLLPSPLAFNHAVARVQVGNQSWVLDGTRGNQTGPLSERESFNLGKGLLAQTDARDLLGLKNGSLALLADATDTISFAKIAQDPTLDASVTYYGASAEGIRAYLTGRTAEELERSFVSDYVRAYGNATLMDKMTIHELKDRNAVRLQMRFALPDYLKLSDKNRLYGEFAHLHLQSVLRLPDQSPRTTALRLSSPGIYRQTIEMTVPEEVSANVASQRFDEANPRFEFHVQYEYGKRSNKMSSELQVLTDTVTPAEWAAYRETLVKIWPRTMGSGGFAVLRLDQVEGLRAALTATEEKLKSGRLISKTSIQTETHYQLALSQALLDSGRLAPRHRVKVLVDRAADLDHLGRPTESAWLLEEALTLAPNDASVHGARATNFLLRQQDAAASASAQKALALDPQQDSARAILGYSQLYAGKTSEARDTLLHIQKNGGDELRSFATLWLFVANHRLGGNAAQSVADYTSSSSKPAWPYPLVQMVQGKLTMEQVVSAAKENKNTAPGRLCEAYFFLGQQQLAQGQTQAARASFQKAVDTGVTEFLEYEFAKRELSALASR